MCSCPVCFSRNTPSEYVLRLEVILVNTVPIGTSKRQLLVTTNLPLPSDLPTMSDKTVKTIPTGLTAVTPRNERDADSGQAVAGPSIGRIREPALDAWNLAHGRRAGCARSAGPIASRFALRAPLHVPAVAERIPLAPRGACAQAAVGCARKPQRAGVGPNSRKPEPLCPASGRGGLRAGRNALRTQAVKRGTRPSVRRARPGVAGKPGARGRGREFTGRERDV